MLPNRLLKFISTFLLVFALCTINVVPYGSAEQSIHTEETLQNGDALQELTNQLDELLQDSRLEGALAGVSVRSAETGEVLYGYNDDIRITPASTQKLLVGASALEVLGPDYTFETLVLTDGKVRGKVLHGNLYLKGKGDPTLLQEDFDQFAETLAAQGIHTVQGDLVADDTWFDDVRLSTDMAWDNESSYSGAQVSALTASPNGDYDAGTVIVEVHAAEPGKPAEVKVFPETDYVTIVNNAETVEEGGRRSISIYREHGNNNIVVEGTMPTNGNVYRTWVTVWQPTGYALDLFRQSLQQAGIRILGDDQVYAATPEDAYPLVTKESMPLSEMFVPFMKLSNNGHAEVLVKEMGKVIHDEGSWSKGLEVVSNYLESLGLNSKTIRLRDGSGMSHLNMIPANELSNLLYLVQEEPWFDVFLTSLPVAGINDRMVGGTLRKRMQNTVAAGNVIAKTGSLTAKTSLSGYVTTADGHKLTFAILLNNYIGASPKDIEDDIAILLAEFSY